MKHIEFFFLHFRTQYIPFLDDFFALGGMEAIFIPGERAPLKNAIYRQRKISYLQDWIFQLIFRLFTANREQYRVTGSNREQSK